MEVPNYVPLTNNPRKPTQAEPGSPEKIAILGARARLEIPLHNDGDRVHESTPGMLLHHGNTSCRMLFESGMSGRGIKHGHLEKLLHDDYSNYSKSD